MKRFLNGTITGTTAYNQNGCDTPGACNTTSLGSCSFFFGYTWRDPRRTFHQWLNASPDLGGNRGDIATA